jgi:catechol 2,3-dioxygenase-like lactoylglutathione lyase family enzyme
MKFICPLIVVNDIIKARYFYETILGQIIKADYGQNISFQGDFSLHEKEHYQTLIGNHPVRTQSNSFELYFEENDLQELQEKLIEHKVEFLHRIREQPWKQRVMRFYDYDRNIIEVGETLEYTAFRLSKEGFTIDEICKITYLTKELVTESIRKFGLIS